MAVLAALEAIRLTNADLEIILLGRSQICVLRCGRAARGASDCTSEQRPRLRKTAAHRAVWAIRRCGLRAQMVRQLRLRLQLRLHGRFRGYLVLHRLHLGDFCVYNLGQRIPLGLHGADVCHPSPVWERCWPPWDLRLRDSCAGGCRLTAWRWQLD